MAFREPAHSVATRQRLCREAVLTVSGSRQKYYVSSLPDLLALQSAVLIHAKHKESIMRRVLKSVAMAVLLVSAAGVSTEALAAHKCRNDQGQFTKCPAKSHPAAKKCRDATTKKFASCDAPGSEPVPHKAK